MKSAYAGPMEQIFGKWGANVTDAARAPALAAELAARAERWMLGSAFPFWAKQAPSPDGGFFERLSLDGRPVTGEDSRVRVQARMGYSFALAAELGWDREQSRQLAERAVAVLAKECRRDDGLYGRMVRPGRGLTDDTAQAYDTAFALLAFATAYRTLGLESARQAGEELSQAIDSELIRPAEEGGYKEQLPAPAIRAQNPHMHLTEASIAWFEASGDPASLKRAETIVGFLRQRFFRDDLGLLVEFDGVEDAENRTEAGHMFEWVWILGRLRALGGAVPEGFADAMHTGGLKLIDGLGYLPLSQNLHRAVVAPQQRTWGPTEMLKAHIAQWRAQPSDERAVMVVTTAQNLFADHIDGALPGAWIDTISPARDPLITDITPATGYHVFLAFKELMDFARELATHQ
ncbi:AGE family epimerase/isomerase [Pontixanthobacter aquaemixtae]|uniref:Mannose-6-phosphate isomerase n=1 Tax=Pontixanthobacter aquaemixtae TaxID=1958940 RepID=A0A844ZW50_9SPHN|nr:AGE family epimerase/isomerase [Pontixanthobacter aquaemixtae]MXO90987.1 hypothetical protein [Pontixanthobacter aquaemixtae]